MTDARSAFRSRMIIHNRDSVLMVGFEDNVFARYTWILIDPFTLSSLQRDKIEHEPAI